MIPMLGQGYLYAVNRHRQRFLDELEKRKAYRITIAIFTVLAIGVFAWIIRP